MCASALVPPALLQPPGIAPSCGFAQWPEAPAETTATLLKKNRWLGLARPAQPPPPQAHRGVVSRGSAEDRQRVGPEGGGLRLPPSQGPTYRFSCQAAERGNWTHSPPSLGGRKWPWRRKRRNADIGHTHPREPTLSKAIRLPGVGGGWGEKSRLGLFPTKEKPETKSHKSSGCAL